MAWFKLNMEDNPQIFPSNCPIKSFVSGLIYNNLYLQFLLYPTEAKQTNSYLFCISLTCALNCTTYTLSTSHFLNCTLFHYLKHFFPSLEGEAKKSGKEARWQTGGQGLSFSHSFIHPFIFRDYVILIRNLFWEHWVPRVDIPRMIGSTSSYAEPRVSSSSQTDRAPLTTVSNSLRALEEPKLL